MKEVSSLERSWSFDGREEAFLEDEVAMCLAAKKPGGVS
jgi:hypothetical protein